MKNLIFFLAIAGSLLLTSCGAGPGAEEPLDRDHLSELIQALNGTLQEQKDQERTDTATARDLADRAEEFAQRFPQDTLAPKFLFQAATASRGIGDFNKAVELWSKVATEYNSHRKAPEALFLQGFTLDENLRDTTRARRQYEAFLEQYPKHPLANDARVLLEAIRTGKSAGDLVEEFKQQQQE
ncbi:MAG: tetratricopeptide repeat protein [Phaeodactylibacter sp.]|nr:tetratricopeptide repeat protein [Phaeodactylibacter sp.]